MLLLDFLQTCRVSLFWELPEELGAFFVGRMRKSGLALLVLHSFLKWREYLNTFKMAFLNSLHQCGLSILILHSYLQWRKYLNAIEMALFSSVHQRSLVPPILHPGLFLN